MGEETKDVFHKEYKELTDEEKGFVEETKILGDRLYEIFEKVGTPNCGREIALAKTKLEESVMWAVKGITK